MIKVYEKENKLFVDPRGSILTNKTIYTVSNYLPNKRLSNAKKNQPTPNIPRTFLAWGVLGIEDSKACILLRIGNPKVLEWYNNPCCPIFPPLKGKPISNEHARNFCLGSWESCVYFKHYLHIIWQKRKGEIS